MEENFGICGCFHSYKYTNFIGMKVQCGNVRRVAWMKTRELAGEFLMRSGMFYGTAGFIKCKSREFRRKRKFRKL